MKDEPGQCPICGMKLVQMGTGHPKSGSSHSTYKAHDTDAAHNTHEGHSANEFLRRFWLSLLIALPVLLLSPMIQEWFGFNLRFPADKYVLLALGTSIYFYGGMPFLRGMAGELRSKAIGMMTLVALAISVAYIYSVAVVLGLPGMDFFLGAGNAHCNHVVGALARNAFSKGRCRSVGIIGGTAAK